ncbi:MAG: bifunctional anthranilate synthase component II/anthranilate phosphoribosyltransferase [Spirochaetales bacterium]|nr:bifunctional anthranilate synthase component II/anthranilate phosphoribosyltransferase [Spirochaetales bacterium]
MYVLIDNYDSFTYNIFQYLSELTDEEVIVYRNDCISIAEIQKLDPKGIIISPGPGRPETAGISVEAIRHFAGKVPILGVCLGLQSIGYAFGADIIQAKRIVHGKAESMTLDGKGLFRSLPPQAMFTRYHSLVIDEKTLPPELEITARSDDGEIMGVRHKEYLVEGVQFHPESITSEFGKQLLSNFLNYRRDPFPMKQLLNAVMNGQNLSHDEAADFMNELTEGNLSAAVTAAFLAALNTKGICAEEIAGCASVLHKKKVSINSERELLDTCGTGGDGLHTFNISSFSALIAAAAGAHVAKHGNRGISSKSGSSDFYGSLGIKIDLKPEQMEKVLDKTGFCFMFAPMYHSAMRHAGSVRRDLGVKTIMNLLGPLANPAGAQRQLIGVFDEKFCPLVARAAKMLGLKKVMVVHGKDGEDEISVCSDTRIFEIDENGSEKDYLFKPEDAGVSRYKLDDIIGGTPDENAAMARDILKGSGKPALRDAVCLNAGAALCVYGLADSIASGYKSARLALDEGEVSRKLNSIVELTTKL